VFLTAVPQLHDDQREACSASGGDGFDFAFSRFPLSLQIFGTARNSQGRALYARRRKIFSALEKIFRSVPLTHLLHRDIGSYPFSVVCNFENGLVTRFLSTRAELKFRLA
jgi:hypothetical protein